MEGNVDAIGYPKRKTGDHLKFKSTGRSFVVVRNLGLMVLCPCADALIVNFDDTGDEIQIDNSLDIVEY